MAAVCGCLRVGKARSFGECFVPFAIRPYRNQDYQAVERIGAAVRPDSRADDAEWMRAAREESAARRIRCLYVAVGAATNEVVGYGGIEPLRGAAGAAGGYSLDLMVHPEWQRHGIGRRLYGRLMEDLQLLSAA